MLYSIACLYSYFGYDIALFDVAIGEKLLHYLSLIYETILVKVWKYNLKMNRISAHHTTKIWKICGFFTQYDQFILLWIWKIPYPSMHLPATWKHNDIFYALKIYYYNIACILLQRGCIVQQKQIVLTSRTSTDCRVGWLLHLFSSTCRVHHIGACSGSVSAIKPEKGSNRLEVLNLIHVNTSSATAPSPVAKISRRRKKAEPNNDTLGQWCMGSIKSTWNCQQALDYSWGILR